MEGVVNIFVRCVSWKARFTVLQLWVATAWKRQADTVERRKR
jgi:hypothetical protein